MKILNSDVFLSREPLQKLIKERLPGMVSYKIAKLVIKLNDEFRAIEEVRLSLVNRLGKDDGKGGKSVPEGTPEYAKFVEEFNELMKQEVEIDLNEKIKLPEKVDGKDLQIEPEILILLDKFVEVG